MRQNILVEYIALLAEKQFENVDYGIVREYVPPLKNVTKEEVDFAVATYKRNYPDKTPNLTNLLPYISQSTSINQFPLFPGLDNKGSGTRHNFRNDAAVDAKRFQKENRATLYDFRAPLDKCVALEERLIFIDLLRREYLRQLDAGELDSRGFIPFSLLQSLEFADDAASKGLPLHDWAASQTVGDIFTRKGDRALHSYRVGGICNRQGHDEDFHIIRTQVLQALSFIKAHLAAEETFKAEFASITRQSLTLAEKTVIDESREQVARAESAINAFDAEDVNVVKSQYVCQILLHKSANYFEKLAHNGLMTEREAGEFLEKYDHELRKLRKSSELKAEIHHLNQIFPEAFKLGALETIHGSESSAYLQNELNC